jgi:pyruvate formate lyase activating enzyme
MKSSSGSATMDYKPTARILDIQRMSTEDGPGIRTTVFFKGCSLKCKWCHNPESISMQPQVHWIGSRCLGCKTCTDVCPSSALSFTETGVEINRLTCTGCGICAIECPAAAMELLGKAWTLDALTKEVVKDRVYFEKSRGGITVSGGEPGMQAAFVGMFLKSLKEAGIHTALDTCGQCGAEALKQLLPHSSLVLYDLKEIDTENHKKFTGEHNDRILENLRVVAETMRSHRYPEALWIRTPVIPGMTAREDNILGIGRFIAENMGDVVSRWELCAFNNLCKDKYLRLGEDWALLDALLLKKESMEAFARIAGESGVHPDIVGWTGATRLEEKPFRENRSAAN